MSDNDVSIRKVLAIVTNYGVEQDELLVPLEHLRGGAPMWMLLPCRRATFRRSSATRLPEQPLGPNSL